MKKSIILLFSSLLATTSYAKPKLNIPTGGKAISTELIGIFFEDISSSADGGLCAELVQNGSFEFNANERDGWGPMTAWRILRPGHSLGMTETRQANPIHKNNPNYIHINVERVGRYYDYKGWTGYGIQNNGFDGISVCKDDRYDFSIFLRGKNAARIVLVEGRDNILAEDTIVFDCKEWQKFACTLIPNNDCPQASLQILFIEKGDVDVDMVSLMPQDTYHGHGLRRDMCEALEALNPRFLRFPGGCIVHGGGDGFWNTYLWKNTIGPKEERKQLKNCWGYHQSFGLGYQEYFQLCEDMKMEPLPILPCGVSCQGANGGWGMRHQAQDACPMGEIDRWAQDALDLIEWANGDINTHWGAIRAKNGHPAPFNLKYIGIGNEERISPEFEERFTYIYNKVREKHPEIIIVGTAGPGSHHGNPDYENGWRIADKLALDIIDEHYYEQRDYFLKSKQYDDYDRNRKTKVYLGEYAAKDKKLLDALAEALYLIHVERNADVVTMTSYAPLFAKKNHTNWNPDLIYFDNERCYLTCSYYTQQMFGKNSGDYYYGDVVTMDNKDQADASCVLNSKTRKLYVKITNASSEPRTATLNLKRFGVKKNAKITTLTGDDPMAENNFDQQPIEPKTTDMKVKDGQTLDIQPYSFSVIEMDI